MFHRVAGQLPVHKPGSARFSSNKIIPADLPWESLLCRLGSVTALHVDGEADLEGFSSRVISWFHVSTSRKPVSPNEDLGTHVLDLKRTRGMFGALPTPESNEHSHSGSKGL